MVLRATLLLTLAAAISGLVLRAPLRMPAVARATTPVMAVEDVAKACLDEGCSVDTVDDLITELKEESKALTSRMQAVLILLGRLEALSGMPEANKSEIEKLVGAASRSFSVVEGFEFKGEPLGYSLKPSMRNKLE
eukprot:CAMPEP_0183348498 /NCGR_PEP_ID=MMETSP0164_2-20130417/12991_1 /TAXON_ID=221442 /ORGANISM="Coccolithus pelagicus ssp braarudi, Strain PLY182g" /LENGTH=135 /DNA_ID=CAMNT_0025520107 /DNA_START=45 /DNA_END=452 /DNA_ORIENTATION=+